MRSKHKIVTLAVVATLTLLMPSCKHHRYAYLEDAPRNEAMDIVNNYNTTIYPDDLLYIYVYSQIQTSVLPFNEETNKTMQDASGRVVKTDSKIKGYRVDGRGMIQFPLLGEIKASKMTLDGLAREIEARLVEGRYVKDPLVTVSLMNFRVTVIGEVNKPGLLHGLGNRMTILEAIALCGDVTMDGLRERVTVVHQGDSDVVVDTVDLTSKRLLESPCYYMRSGDIVYVEPIDNKKRMATRSETWPQYLTTSVAAIRAAALIVYRYVIIGKRLN